MKIATLFLLLITLGATATASDKATATPVIPQATPYVIGVDDVLLVSVWKDQELTHTVPVRPDGFITLPLIGEVKADGRTAEALKSEIVDRLHQYMTNPVVTVSVQEIRSRKINVVGEILKPGSYILAHQMNVIDAIAMAGGFKEFAKPSKVYVLRRNADGTTTRMPFNYKEAIRGGAKVLDLQTQDTVVVP